MRHTTEYAVVTSGCGRESGLLGSSSFWLNTYYILLRKQPWFVLTAPGFYVGQSAAATPRRSSCRCRSAAHERFISLLLGNHRGSIDGRPFRKGRAEKNRAATPLVFVVLLRSGDLVPADFNSCHSPSRPRGSLSSFQVSPNDTPYHMSGESELCKVGGAGMNYEDEKETLGDIAKCLFRALTLPHDLSGDCDTPRGPFLGNGRSSLSEKGSVDGIVKLKPKGPSIASSKQSPCPISRPRTILDPCPGALRCLP